MWWEVYDFIKNTVKIITFEETVKLIAVATLITKLVYHGIFKLFICSIFIIKVFILVFLLILVRGSTPRLRLDHIYYISWLRLLLFLLIFTLFIFLFLLIL